MTYKYGPPRNCHDNAIAESFCPLLKAEHIKRKINKTRSEARSDIFNCIELFYNLKRHHGNNGRLSPIEPPLNPWRLNMDCWSSIDFLGRSSLSHLPTLNMDSLSGGRSIMSACDFNSGQDMRWQVQSIPLLPLGIEIVPVRDFPPAKRSATATFHLKGEIDVAG